MKKPIISFEDFSFKYHLRENWALEKINLEISKGDFVVFTGSSGSGKSSLCYSILGLIPSFYEGELKGKLDIDNQKVGRQSVFSASEFIGYIPQRVESSLITPYVLTELAFPLEYQNYDKETMEERIEKVVSQLNLKALLYRDPQKTSEGEKQMIAIGCALIREPSIIIADEPLANLDRRNREMIKSVFQKLNEEGKTIIIASHEYKQYLPFATKIVKLERGIITKEISADNFRKETTKSTKEKIVKQNSKQEIESEKVKLKLNEINFNFQRSFSLSKITFTAKKGEIIGITGDNGSGKTTLLKIIGGMLKPNSGSLEIIGKEPKDLNWYIRAEIFGIVFQNPELQFFEETVKDEIALTKRNLGKKFDKTKITELLKDINLEGYGDYNPHSLSHGEKRRIAYLASVFHDPEIIMIDEITNGLDEENKEWIKRNLLEQKQKGKVILVISHDWEWLVGLVDRVVYLEDGKIKTEMNESQFISFRNKQLKEIEKYEEEGNE